MSKPAPRARRASTAVAAALRPSRLPAPALNDDGADPDGEALLRAALRLFAEHGLGAARHAHGRAEASFFAGDAAGYRWWLAVTRTLDRRLAADLAATCDKAESDRALPRR